jgi:hypothetical protein
MDTPAKLPVTEALAAYGAVVRHYADAIPLCRSAPRLVEGWEKPWDSPQPLSGRTAPTSGPSTPVTTTWCPATSRTPNPRGTTCSRCTQPDVPRETSTTEEMSP